MCGGRTEDLEVPQREESFETRGMKPPISLPPGPGAKNSRALLCTFS